MSFQEKQLGQARPSGTTPVSLYSPGAGITAIIKNIVICNTTGAAAKFSIYHHEAGSTYDASTALFFDATIQKNQTISISSFMAMKTLGGNLAVQTDTANALTFTAYGAEVAA